MNNYRVDKALSEISVAYKNEQFIAEQLAPMVPVAHDTGKFYVYSKDNLRLDETFRANGAPVREIEWNISNATYTLYKHGLGKMVTDDDVKDQDEGVNLEVDAVEALTEKIKLRRENSVIELIHTAANWANTTSLTSTYAWSAQTSLSNPIKFVDSATTAILKGTGKRANVVFMDDSTFKAAKEHPSIVDRIKYTSADSVSEDILAKLFNIENVYVSRSVYNTADEGQADSMSFQMTDCCFVAYIEKSPSKLKPSALYMFTQRESGMPFAVKKYRDEAREGTMVEVNTKYGPKIVCSDCGYLIVNTIQ